MHMQMVADIIIGLVLLTHVYIFLLETVWFDTRGRKVFGLSAEQAKMMKAAMSNQGCYNAFLAAALACGFLLQDAATARAFAVYGLVCVAIAGVWGAATVKTRILYVQTVPAVLGLVALLLAR
jgi:putative membrane protein